MAEDEDKEKRNLQNLLAKHGNDSLALATMLLGENAQLREDKRQLKAKIPAEGSLVLSADEAKKWNAFQELKQEPKEIKKALEKVSTLETENKELSRAESLREAAGAHGYKATVLKELLSKFPEATISLKEETDSKTKATRKVAYITHDGKESSLEGFADANFKDFLPALKAEQAQTNVSNSNDPKPTSTGSSFFDKIRESVKTGSDSSKANEIDARFGLTN